MSKLLDWLFGCTHDNYSFPLTVRGQRRGAARVTGTYVCCLDCGREFPYDLDRMRIVREDEVSTLLVAEERETA